MSLHFLLTYKFNMANVKGLRPSFHSFSAGIDFIYRRQILTSKVDPRTQGVKDVKWRMSTIGNKAHFSMFNINL